MVPQKYLEAAAWQSLPVDVLHVVYADGTVSPGSSEPSAIYQPVDRVPAFIICRTSESEKRLESQFSALQVGTGAWGTLFEVQGAGAPLGLLLQVAEGTFCGAHALPDMVHLVACAEDLPSDSVVKDVFEARTIKVFQVGPADESSHHDLMMTTKNRWFRNRNNPKFLGFSKDDKL